MTHDNVLIINKQELIQAALELEKQETLHACFSTASTNWKIFTASSA